MSHIGIDAVLLPVQGEPRWVWVERNQYGALLTSYYRLLDTTAVDFIAAASTIDMWVDGYVATSGQPVAPINALAMKLLQNLRGPDRINDRPRLVRGSALLTGAAERNGRTPSLGEAAADLVAQSLQVSIQRSS